MGRKTSGLTSQTLWEYGSGVAKEQGLLIGTTGKKPVNVSLWFKREAFFFAHDPKVVLDLRI